MEPGCQGYLRCSTARSSELGEVDHRFRLVICSIERGVIDAGTCWGARARGIFFFFFFSSHVVGWRVVILLFLLALFLHQ